MPVGVVYICIATNAHTLGTHTGTLSTVRSIGAFSSNHEYESVISFIEKHVNKQTNKQKPNMK